MSLYTLASIMPETVNMPPITAHTYTMKCRMSSFVYQYVMVVGAKSYLLLMIYYTLITYLHSCEL